MVRGRTLFFVALSGKSPSFGHAERIAKAGGIESSDELSRQTGLVLWENRSFGLGGDRRKVPHDRKSTTSMIVGKMGATLS